MEQLQLTKEQEEAVGSVDVLVAESEMTVKDTLAHTVASDMLVQLQTKKRDIEDIREFMLEPIKNAKRELESGRKRWVNFFQTPIDVLTSAMGELDGRMVFWRRDERRKAEVKAQQERATEEKKRESQRKKQEKIAGGLEKKGLDESAAEVRDQMAFAPVAAVVVAPKINTVQGANIKIKKVAEVDIMTQQSLLIRAVDRYNMQVDEANTKLNEGEPAFLKVVAAGYWMLNLKALNDFGQKTDGQISIPGVRWVEDEKTQPRRRR